MVVRIVLKGRHGRTVRWGARLVGQHPIYRYASYKIDVRSSATLRTYLYTWLAPVRRRRRRRHAAHCPYFTHLYGSNQPIFSFIFTSMCLKYARINIGSFNVNEYVYVGAASYSWLRDEISCIYIAFKDTCFDGDHVVFCIVNRNHGGEQWIQSWWNF